jgi:O-antigen/teichoic acid export membrane protein
VYWWFAARRFSPEAVGYASATISAMTLLGTFSLLGLNTLLIGELSRRRGEEASLIGAALLVVGGVGVGLGGVYAVVGPYVLVGVQGWDAVGGDSVARVANGALFVVGVGLTAMTLVLDQALIGLLRGELQLWRNGLFAMVKLVALLAVSSWLTHAALGMLSDAAGVGIFTTWVIGTGVSLAALGGYAQVKRGWRRIIELPQWGLLRRLGTAALMHHALNVTLQAPSLILPMLVTVLLSVKVNGWFYVAWNLSSVANTISVALATTLYAVGVGRPEALGRKLRVTVGLAFLACVLTNGVLLLATKQVLGVFGHGYAQEASWSLRVLALESFPFIIKNHYIALARIRGEVGRTTLVMIATGICELVGSGVGAHVGGLNGLSLGWLTVMCVEAMLMGPTVYRAARLVNVVEQLAVATLSSGQETRCIVGVAPNMPWHVSKEMEPNFVVEQAVWLADTLVLRTIGGSENLKCATQAPLHHAGTGGSVLYQGGMREGESKRGGYDEGTQGTIYAASTLRRIRLEQWEDEGYLNERELLAREGRRSDV